MSKAKLILLLLSCRFKALAVQHNLAPYIKGEIFNETFCPEKATPLADMSLPIIGYYLMIDYEFMRKVSE